MHITEMKYHTYACTLLNVSAIKLPSSERGKYTEYIAPTH